MVQVIDVTELNIFSKKKGENQIESWFWIEFICQRNEATDRNCFDRPNEIINTSIESRAYAMQLLQIDIFFLFGLCLFPSESR